MPKNNQLLKLGVQMSCKHFSLEERYYIKIELRKGTYINSIGVIFEYQGQIFLFKALLAEEIKSSLCFKFKKEFG